MNAAGVEHGGASDLADAGAGSPSDTAGAAGENVGGAIGETSGGAAGENVGGAAGENVGGAAGENVGGTAGAGTSAGGEGGEGGSSDVDVPPEPIIALASGAYHQCILYGAGRVKCWGSNDYGQLGLGDTNARGDEPGEMGAELPDVDLGTGRWAKSIAAGWYATCAILDDDSLKCWGLWAVAAIGKDEHIGDQPDEMGDHLLPMSLGTGRKVRQVSLGAEHACAVLDDDSLKCWGWDAWNQTGVPPSATDDDETVGNDPGEMGDDLAPLDFGGMPAVAEVAAGGMHTCARLVSGGVQCFGYLPGLGNYTAGSIGVSPLIPLLSLGTARTAKQITAGYNHSCAILDDDSLKCWGQPVAGELGLGSNASHGYEAGFVDDMGDALPVVDLGTGRHALELRSPGDQHTCALLDDHRLKCWGLNTIGRLGLGDEVWRGDDPGEMGDALPALDFGAVSTVKLFSKGLHGCVVLEDEQLKCWGYNAAGQLGLGDTEIRGDAPGEMGASLPAVRWW